MQIYYAENWNEGTFYLSPDESRHIISVLRHQVGDRLAFTDGKGTQIMGEIVIANPKKTEVVYISSQTSNKNPSTLHIAISPTKSNDRFEWFLEKACEIGIGKITPLYCERTERKKINIDRWNKIIVSACKQSKQLYFPELFPLTPFAHFIEKYPEGMIAKIGASKMINSKVVEKNTPILIGPEGDFSETEFEMAKQQLYKDISLSDTILRVETAGIVAASQWAYLSQSS